MNILWLKTELLHPVDKGGKIRTYGMLKELKRHHQITYLTLDTSASPEAIERAQEYCHRVVRIPHQVPRKFSARFYVDLLANLGSPLPYALRAYRSRAMRKAIEEEAGSGKVDLIVADFLAPSPNLPPGLRVPTLLFQHNVEAMIWKRHFELARNPAKKIYLWLEWRKMFRAEGIECRKYDQVVAVSREDAEILEAWYGLDHVEHVPTGVDVEFFRSMGASQPDPLEVVFTGSMDWLPNQDAVNFFLDEVFPLLIERHPKVKFTVVGRAPPRALFQRAETDERLSVTGFVEDVRPYLDRAGILVVPIRIGGGTRLKIFEGMAMGKPVVSTTVGAEGLPLVPGRDILIADEGREMAEVIGRLLDNPHEIAVMGTLAQELVRDRFGWSVVAAQFSEACERVVERRRQRPSTTSPYTTPAD